MNCITPVQEILGGIVKNLSPPEIKKTIKAEKLAEQIALFSSLPDCALVALPVVCAIKGRSPASIWRDVKAGRIAKPLKAGPRCTRWQVGDLRAPIRGGDHE